MIFLLHYRLKLWLSVNNYRILAGSTRRCPGHCIKIIKCTVRAKVARKVRPKVLHLLFNKLCLKMHDHGSRSTWGQGSFLIRITGPKIWSAPTKTDLPYNFCFIKFLPSCMVEAVDALQTLFRAPTPDLALWLRLGGLYLTKFISPH